MYQTFRSYKKEPITEQYDAIVIGSGISGLSVAGFLAKEGKKVVVLEQHYTAGGFTQIFKRRGYEWDVGIHYIGDVHRPNSTVRRIFDYLTDGTLEWADMGEVYDKIIFGDEVYNFRKGKKQFVAQLKEYFPDPKDHKAIDEYMVLVKEAVRGSRTYFMEKALPSAVQWLVGGRMRRKMLRHSDKTTLEVMRSLTDNPKLIGVLTGQYGDYGLPPGQSSFVMHAMLVNHYFNGGYFPVGGSSRIVETMAPTIEANGGMIMVKAAVKEVLVENGKAVGVLMSDDKEVRAPIVISSAGVGNTYSKLIPEEYRKKHNLEKSLSKTKPSVSHVCLYMGFNESTEALGLKPPNFWIYPKDGYDHDTTVARYLEDINNPFPIVYASFPSAKDPDWPNRYPGKATIDLITLAPYGMFSEWEDTRWKKRGEEYDQLKEQFSQRLMNKLFEYLPNLKGKVDYYELSTPLSTRHFMNYDQGEIYGLEHTPARFRQKFLKPTTPIKNLYLTGQDIVTVGIGGALASGLLTASTIQRKNLFDRLPKYQKA